MRHALIAICTMLCPLTPAVAQLSINFGTPGVSIGINMPVYPQLQRVPGYPVYYAPGVNTNYFFYDGLYWVYERDNWYASSWYNGPWGQVDPVYVPVYLLRVPVRYYRHAPAYFHGWRADAAPRWGEHWGQSWEQRRTGWDQWNRSSAPAPAPLPTYQREYSGNRYPQPSQQAVIQTQNYRYQPKDAVAQHQFDQQRAQVRSAPQPQAQQRPQAQQQTQAPQQQHAARQQATPQQPPQHAERPPQQAQAAHEQHAPQVQEKHAPQVQENGAQGKGHDKEQEKGKGHDKEQEKGKGHEKDKEKGQER